MGDEGYGDSKEDFLLYRSEIRTNFVGGVKKCAYIYEYQYCGDEPTRPTIEYIKWATRNNFVK